jgi:hypothetical protein
LAVTIWLTGSAGLRPAWPRRAIAIAGAGSRWSLSLRPAMVPPARPYPLIAPFRELRVLVPLGTAALGRRDTLEG